MITRPVPSFIEALESRLAPAGLVALTFQNGALTITGDDGVNNVHIDATADGRLHIYDKVADDTIFTLNGQPSGSEALLTVTGAVTVNLLGGNDRLTFEGVQISGPITIKDTGGNDTFEFVNSTLNKAVTIDTGVGDDTISADGSTFNGLLTLKTGAGNDTVDLGRGTYRSITADLGTTGTDGNRTDAFLLADGTIGASINVLGNVTVTSKGGIDGIANISLGADNFHLLGNVKVTLGTGSGNLSLNPLSAEDNLHITGGLSFQGSAGNDLITLADSITIGGKLDLKLGKGNGEVTSTSLDSLSLGSFGYTAGTGTNTVTLAGQTLTIGGDAIFSMAAGTTNKVFFESTTQALIGGNITYTGAKLYDVLNIETPDFRALGLLTFNGGKGYSNLSVQPTTAVFGAITYKGTTGYDSVQIGSSDQTTTAITILGNLSINLAGNNANEGFIFDTTVYGTTSLLSITTVPKDSFGNEPLVIADSLFIGAVTVKSTGNVDGELRINNSIFRSALSVDTGKGNDTVFFDNHDGMGQGNKLAKNIFHGPVKILLGAGDDNFTAGKDNGGVNFGNTFRGIFTLDGGTGTDTSLRTPAFGNTFEGAVSEKGIE